MPSFSRFGRRTTARRRCTLGGWAMERLYASSSKARAARGIKTRSGRSSHAAPGRRLCADGYEVHPEAVCVAIGRGGARARARLLLRHWLPDRCHLQLGDQPRCHAHGRRCLLAYLPGAPLVVGPLLVGDLVEHATRGICCNTVSFTRWSRWRCVRLCGSERVWQPAFRGHEGAQRVHAAVLSLALNSHGHMYDVLRASETRLRRELLL